MYTKLPRMEGGLFSWAKKQVDDVFRKKEHTLSDCNIVLNHKKVQAVSEGWGGGVRGRGWGKVCYMVLSSLMQRELT